MNELVEITRPARDLISPVGTFNDMHFLFRCELITLAGNIRTLLAEYRNARAALCQNLAVAYLRCKRGETNVTWETWCERFVRKPDGKPYSPTTIKHWVDIGMKPDVEAAWAKAQDDRRADAYVKNGKMQRRAVHAEMVLDHTNAALGPKMAAAVRAIPAPQLCRRDPEKDRERQFRVLLAAWEAADEAVRERFLQHIGH